MRAAKEWRKTALLADSTGRFPYLFQMKSGGRVFKRAQELKALRLRNKAYHLSDHIFRLFVLEMNIKNK